MISVEETHAGGDGKADAVIREWADYCGFQEDGNGGGFELWNLRKPLGHHPVGSTVTRSTILKFIS